MEENHNINVKKTIALSGLLVLLLVLGTSAAMAQAGDIEAKFNSSVTEGYSPLAVQFNDLSLGDNISSWDWNFGDNTHAYGPNPVHTYSAPGYYTVSLKVTNNESATDTVEESDYINVKPGPDPTKPIANFSASPTSGNKPLTVKFTDTSTGNINSWYWSFGDGVHSSSKNPTHTYNSLGSYNVSLKVMNTSGPSNTTIKYRYINVTAPLNASFSANVKKGVAPISVQFTSNTFGIKTWNWDFGDGATSNVTSPMHTYSAPGNYTVKLTITDAYGNTLTDEEPNYIQVSSPEPPVFANFSASPNSGNVPLTVQFTDSSTVNSTTSISSWNWNFGDGTTSTTKNPVHTYTKLGFYNATLKVTYNTSVTSLKVVPITAAQLPVANFKSNINNGVAPLSVNFTDISTGQPKSWLWNFGDGATSTDQNPNHKYTSAGTYDVSLTVTNAFGTDIDEENGYITVTPSPVQPVADFSASQTSYTPIKETFTDKSSGNPTSWLWTFGDGTRSKTKSPVHTYSTAGTYTVTLTITDANGATASKSTTVTVTNVAKPVAAFTAKPTSGKAPLTVVFKDRSTGSPTSWRWSFGDGAVKTSQNPVHTYSKAGSYKVTLTVTNAAGSNTVTKSGYIVVK